MLADTSAEREYQRKAGVRHVYLCADDYGMAPGINAAIRDLVMRGRINATSVMVVAPTFGRSEAAALAMLNVEHRRVAIGLHLTLTAPFAPLSPGFRPIKDGVFPPLASMFRLGLLWRLDRRALAAEIDAQFVAFGRAFGRPPEFIDGHQHVHLLPQVREALLRAVLRFAPDAWVRQCGHTLPVRQQLAQRKAMFLSLLSRGMRRRGAMLGVRTNPTFAGAYEFTEDADFAALFPSFLAGQEEGGVVMCHPGFVDAELERLDPLTALRAKEHAYLVGEAFAPAMAAAGLALAWRENNSGLHHSGAPNAPLHGC